MLFDEIYAHSSPFGFTLLRDIILNPGVWRNFFFAFFDRGSPDVKNSFRYLKTFFVDSVRNMSYNMPYVKTQPIHRRKERILIMKKSSVLGRLALCTSSALLACTMAACGAKNNENAEPDSAVEAASTFASEIQKDSSGESSASSAAAGFDLSKMTPTEIDINQLIAANRLSEVLNTESSVTLRELYKSFDGDGYESSYLQWIDSKYIAFSSEYDISVSDNQLKAITIPSVNKSGIELATGTEDIDRSNSTLMDFVCYFDLDNTSANCFSGDNLLYLEFEYKESEPDFEIDDEEKNYFVSRTTYGLLFDAGNMHLLKSTGTSYNFFGNPISETSVSVSYNENIPAECVQLKGWLEECASASDAESCKINVVFEPGQPYSTTYETRVKKGLPLVSYIENEYLFSDAEGKNNYTLSTADKDTTVYVIYPEYGEFDDEPFDGEPVG